MFDQNTYRNFVKFLQGLFISLFCLIIIYSPKSFADDIATIDKEDGVLIVNIKAEEGDKIFSNYPGSFAFPMNIKIKNIDNLKSFYIDWPWPNFIQEKNNINAFYKKNIKIPIFITPLETGEKVSLNLELDFVICNKNGCFPKNYEFKTDIKDPQTPPTKRLSEIKEEYIKNGKLYVGIQNDFSQKTKFALLNSNGKLYLPKSEISNYKEYDLIFNLDPEEKSKSFLLLSSNNEQINVNPFITQNLNPKYNIVTYICFAFIGGFILNLMPCVLPVLSLKLYSIINAESSYERKIISLLSIFTIIIYFLFIASITVFARNIGEFFIPGFSMQSPSVILICIAIITIAISILMDRVNLNFQVPIFDKLNIKNKYIGVIISTLATTILATPCTAPFLVTSMSFAITESPIIIFTIFAAASLGFGLPYIAALLFPNILNFLPKSGKWQNYLKIIFAILLLITIFWLLSIINSQLGLWAAIATFCLIYLLKMATESNIRNLFKLPVIIITFSLLVTVPQSVGSNFKVISQKNNNFWKVFSAKEIKKLVDEDRVVIVNITADWCITCQYNKLMVLDRAHTARFIRENNIIPFLGDITKSNAEITTFLKENNVSGIPFTIIYGPRQKSGIILPVTYNYGDIKAAFEKVK